MEKYQYRRLSRPETGLGDFRLIVLHRGRFEDPVHVTISTHSLDELVKPTKDKHPTVSRWWALSYVWGDSMDCEDIFVYDKCPDRGPITPDNLLGCMSVTENLIVALRHLRETHVDRWFWVDAICIDQSTATDALEERARQVQSMHQIHAHATGVIIWLGPAGHDSDYALRSLQELGSSIHVDWPSFEIYTKDGVATSALNRWNDPALSSRDRLAVGALLERPWFERIWIRQEAFFANEEASGVFCGHSYVPFAAFRRAIFYLGIIGLGSSEHQSRVRLASLVFERTYADIPNVLRRIRTGNCKDQRDRIYAVLGMISMNVDHKRVVPVKVDYSEGYSADQLYLQFFLQYTKTWNTLGLLEEAGLWQTSNLRPTWVPDWRSTVAKTMLDLSLESATSHFLKAECAFVDEGILRVLGRSPGEVSSTYSLPMEAESTAPAVWCKLMHLIKNELELAEDDDRVEYLSRALWCVTNPVSVGMNDMETTREEIKGYIYYLYKTATRKVPNAAAVAIKPPEEMLSERAAATIKQSMSYLRLKKTQLFFIAKRYVGVGPSAAEPGDRVYAILGSRRLMLLRRIQTRTHQVVGPCFVHGYNWGEAVLGPLPDGYTVVHHYESSRKSYVPHYLNSNSGRSSMWDPRVDWDVLEAHPPMINFVPVNAPLGEPFRVRPDSSYLKRLGVELEEIDLI